MSTFKIPNQGQIRQIGRSDTLGELNESYNLTLTNPFGKIKTSNVLSPVLDVTDLGANNEIEAIAVYDARFYAITDDDVFRCLVSNDPTDSSNWAVESGINTSGFGTETDAVVFDDKLLISRNDDILSWDGSTDDNDWWTAVTSGSALTSNYPHTMHVHRGGQETLFVTDKNLVRYYNGTAGHSTVTLGEDQVAITIDSGVNATWVGTYSTSSDSAFVYEIYVGEVLGSTPVARNAYRVDAQAVLSLRVLNNVPYIITEKGNLQVFNGAGFSTVAQLPFVGDTFTFDGMSIGNINDTNNLRPVHPKGMQASNDSLFVLFSTEEESTILGQDPYANRSPSGIWEYNTVTQTINHRFGFSQSDTNGAKQFNRSGPLLIAENANSLVLAGAEIEGDIGPALFAEGDTSFGYFITQEIMSGSVEDVYESVYLKAKTLADGDTITLKYRTTKRDKVFADGTLADSSTFNTTDDLSTIEVGDEVTVYTGANAGKIAHITAISESASTYSLSLDADLGTTGDNVSVEIINFKKVSDTYTSADGEYKRLGGFDTNPWIQFKVVMDGEVELREFISKGNSKTEL